MGYLNTPPFGAAAVPPGSETWPWPPSGPVGPTTKPPPRPAPKPKPGAKHRPPNPNRWKGPLVICTGKPDFIIDRFVFDSAALRKDLDENHYCEIDCIAREILKRFVTGLPRRIRHVCLMGHTDDIGQPSYNMDLGWDRAEEVRKELCKALLYHAECQRRVDIFHTLTMAVGSAGETARRFPATSADARDRNRRVAVYLQDFDSDGLKCPYLGPVPFPKPQGPIIVRR
jgi:outer membrane protein OmpA-like peptidoglycan-associated protein